ncbi:type II toxin-antitoxin system death-on-curing family toxin [Nodosilinea sp. LEGE 06152]|uniref:type II toxin-antitoxin system death-on-curing family toxin n=1 Tax=Nodosilinea sp. LEGE 06152 TaxID=2777966 RepID=UPI001882B97E|nr:type II toxin-antitoxin system death-on-curing family toxin [Nodosilinea sp. LEGE 06152]MBE9156625.1 type II toxin-antitoxin system death-on-curing family toxin [Nodosilinea sp. LEGE 06152]MBE9160472.1 type II toxin-antitoxin system death-on-curing family toxin [Nodosilinea sp. LEGE 06152]
MPTPNFLCRDDVLLLHADQIESFGGTPGVRDEGLLDSALAQPKASFGGELLHPTLAEQAAAYLYHLSRNHPFIDGNKRTAFAVMDTFLEVNGYGLTLSDDDAYDLVMRVAQGQVDKATLAEILVGALEPRS